MKKLKFTDDLVSGVPDIDAHHRALFDNCNRLLFPREGKSTDQSLKDLLDYLFGYVQYHFAAEESVMLHAGVDVGRHMLQHNYMRNELAEIHLDSRQKGHFDKENQKRLHDLVNDWFSSHIRIHDIALAEALRKQLGVPTLPTVEEVEEEKPDIWADLSINDVKVSKVRGWISESEKNARRKLK